MSETHYNHRSDQSCRSPPVSFLEAGMLVMLIPGCVPGRRTHRRMINVVTTVNTPASWPPDAGITDINAHNRHPDVHHLPQRSDAGRRRSLRAEWLSL